MFNVQIPSHLDTKVYKVRVLFLHDIHVMDEIVSSYPRRYTERFSPGTCEGSSVSSYVRIKRVKVEG